MIFSSKPAKRRRYLPISAGSKRPCRSRGIAQLQLARVGDYRFAAIAIAVIATLRFRGTVQMMVQLGIEHALGQSLLQLIDQAATAEYRRRVSPRQ